MISILNEAQLDQYLTDEGYVFPGDVGIFTPLNVKKPIISDYDVLIRNDYKGKAKYQDIKCKNLTFEGVAEVVYAGNISCKNLNIKENINLNSNNIDCDNQISLESKAMIVSGHVNYLDERIIVEENNDVFINSTDGEIKFDTVEDANKYLSQYLTDGKRYYDLSKTNDIKANSIKSTDDTAKIYSKNIDVKERLSVGSIVVDEINASSITAKELNARRAFATKKIVADNIHSNGEFSILEAKNIIANNSILADTIKTDDLSAKFVKSENVTSKKTAHVSDGLFSRMFFGNNLICSGILKLFHIEGKATGSGASVIGNEKKNLIEAEETKKLISEEKPKKEFKKKNILEENGNYYRIEKVDSKNGNYFVKNLNEPDLYAIVSKKELANLGNLKPADSIVSKRWLPKKYLQSEAKDMQNYLTVYGIKGAKVREAAGSLDAKKLKALDMDKAL